MERVRKYANQPDITLNAAVNRAVDEYINENILADFLRKNLAEVKESTENIVLRMLSAGTYKLEEITHISGMDIEFVENLKIKLPIK